MIFRGVAQLPDLFWVADGAFIRSIKVKVSAGNLTFLRKNISSLHSKHRRLK